MKAKHAKKHAAEAIRQAADSIRADERRHCVRLAEAVLARHDAMGFRHNAERAAGAREVLEALGGAAASAGVSPDTAPHQVQHVCGLTPVADTQF